MSEDHPVIAIELGLHNEQMHRVLQGILTFGAAHPEIALEDCCFFNEKPGFETRAPRWTGKADGAVIGIAREPGVVEWIRRGRVPTVNVGGALMDSPLASVVADIDRMAQLVVEHLSGAGYHNFLYVGRTQADCSRHYREALADRLERQGCDLPFVECPVICFRDSRDSLSNPAVDRRIIGAIKRARKPLGVVAISDQIAAGVCRFARNLGLSIPQEVAVVGYGDTNVARIASPPITTIRPDYERIGYEAARLVHRMIQGKRPASKIVIVTGEELIARASTIGKPRRNGRRSMQHAIDMIQRKACDGIRIPEIAADLQMSTRAFELQFADEVGHTVGEEMRRVRLERAKELLAKTELSVTRIANLVGYSDTTYFAKFFRQREKQTPSEFRQTQSQAKTELIIDDDAPTARDRAPQADRDGRQRSRSPIGP